MEEMKMETGREKKEHETAVILITHATKTDSDMPRWTYIPLTLNIGTSHRVGQVGRGQGEGGWSVMSVASLKPSSSGTLINPADNIHALLMTIPGSPQQEP